MSAVNEFGAGPHATLCEPIIVSEEPGMPTSIICSDITKDAVTVHWNKPDYDGGAELSGFVVEQLDKRENKWKKVTVVSPDNLCNRIKGLTENSLYMFRVCAQNVKGKYKFVLQ